MITCYVAESMVNMVSGLIDQGYEDYAVEAAMSKVFASEALWTTVDDALQIAGGNGFMREFPYERLMRDCRINRIFEGTNEILRLFIALTAMNDVGKQLSDLVTAVKDPIKGFGLFVDYAKRRVATATGYGQDIMGKAHPLLKEHAAFFNEQTRNLNGACDKLLRKHGKNIVGKQFATKRLSDIMIDMFALACTISRVSQSIEEKGAEKAKREIEILNAFKKQAEDRLKLSYQHIDDNDDEIIKALSDYAVENERFLWDNI